MLRSYLATALANLARNWLYAGITILGLAAGFAAAILIGLYVRDEYSFDRFIPGWQDAYRLEMDLVLPGQKPLRVNSSVSTAAANLAPPPPVYEGPRVSSKQVAVSRLTRPVRELHC